MSSVPMPDESKPMQLRVVTPLGVVVDQAVAKIVAHAPNGAFGLLPRHIDFTSELMPGIVTFETAGGVERFLGINEGTLVKCGALVLVATRDAVVGDDLETLHASVKQTFLQLDEHERTARTALARLEAGMIRQFLDLEKTGA